LKRMTVVGAVTAAVAAGISVTPAGASLPIAGTPNTAESAAAALQAARAQATDTARAIGLTSDEKLTVRSVISDLDGSQFVRYDRTYKGLRVVGGDLIVHKSGDAIREVTKNSNNVTVASITPKVSAAAADSKGAKSVSLAHEAAPRSELVIYAPKGRPARLAHEVIVRGVRADKVPSELHIFVDASTGAELGRFDRIETGSGSGLYVGTVTIGTKAHTGGGYEMTDAAGNYATDVHNQGDPNTGSGPVGDLFLDSDDIWGNGSNTDRASAAVDAQYGAEKTFDFYKNVLGRNGIWNDGRGARSRVHFANGMVNAFWDGTEMSYGDGTNNAAPLTELDVAGHEMSHGVTENTAGLNYSGDAGGLNEATSDIFGTAVEFYTNNSKDVPDYFIGEILNLYGTGRPLRWMDKPSRDGHSDDCWSTSTGGKDPHYSSGPLNHWFYLASEGSGAKTINGVSYDSPTCNGSPVTGIGRDKAEKIWYRTLSTKLTSGSTYADARNGAINSAKELYGGSSAECQGVAATFSAIAVQAGSAACDGGTPTPTPSPSPTPTTTTTPPPSGQLLLNPGFESGAVNWTGTAGPITNNTGRPAHSGSWKLWLGGNGFATTETESQTVTIPSTATAATLSYWIRTDTSEYYSYPFDSMQVQVVAGGVANTLATYTNVGTNSTYTQKSFDLSAYKGQSVTIKFVMNEDSSLQTSFVVDDTALTVS
jgi:Zn-dependent metalloprotease